MAIFAALPLLSIDEPDDVIKRYIAASDKNWQRASQYTWAEHADYFNVPKDGPPQKDHSATHEVMFVDGSEGKKLIARHDELPLQYGCRTASAGLLLVHDFRRHRRANTKFQKFDVQSTITIDPPK